jgi:hypothetical protein
LDVFNNTGHKIEFLAINCSVYRRQFQPGTQGLNSPTGKEAIIEIEKGMHWARKNFPEGNGWYVLLVRGNVGPWHRYSKSRRLVGKKNLFEHRNVEVTISDSNDPPGSFLWEFYETD